MLGLDISIWNHDRYANQNGKLPWDKIKEAGTDFVIVRTGAGRSIRDHHFQSDVNDAHSVGLQVGAYHYSYALNPSDVLAEVLFCKQIIAESGVFLEMPVFFDMEDGDGYKKRNGFDWSVSNTTEICRQWFKAIAPLKSGLYASIRWLDDYINWKQLVDEFNIPIWSAQYNSTDDFKGWIWQFTQKLYIDNHLWDANILYDSTHHAGDDPWTLFKQS